MSEGLVAQASQVAEKVVYFVIPFTVNGMTKW